MRELGQLARRRIVIIVHVGGHGYLVESVRAVQAGDGVHIGIQQRLAEASIAREPVRLLHVQPLAQRLRVKVLVACDVHLVHTVLWPAVDGVHHGVMVRVWMLQPHRHRRVKVAVLLQRIAQVLRTLGQQVRIHGTFLIHRHQFLQFAFAHPGADRTHLHHRALVVVEHVVHMVHRRIELLLLQRQGHFKMVPLLIHRAQLGQCARHGVARHLAVLLQLALLAELLQRQSGVALQRHVAHARLRPLLHMEGHVHLQVLRVRLRGRGHGGFVIAVLLQRLLHQLGARIQLVLVEDRARIQLGRAFQQGGQQIRLGAQHLHLANVIARRPRVDQRHPVALLHTTNLDRAVAPRGKEPAHTLPDFFRVQRLASLLRQFLGQGVLALKGHPFEANPGHRPARPLPHAGRVRGTGLWYRLIRSDSVRREVSSGCGPSRLRCWIRRQESRNLCICVVRIGCSPLRARRTADDTGDTGHKAHHRHQPQGRRSPTDHSL